MDARQKESGERRGVSPPVRDAPAGLRRAARQGVFPLACVLLLCGVAHAEDRRRSTVGMPAHIDQIVLPGPELEPRPLTNPRAPIVLRVVNVYPHGSAFRYDLVYYALETGTFDLKDFLRRKDGSSSADLPALRITVETLLPPGQVVPNRLESRGSPWLGGYRLALTIGAVLWGLGLLVLLFAGRWKKQAARGAAVRVVTLADRLRPLVERALAGNLGGTERADLERVLLAYWRRRLRLGDEKPAEVFAQLRRHPEAGPLLEQLEAWLHRPGPVATVDVAALLRPYQNPPADAAEVGAGEEGVAR